MFYNSKNLTEMIEGLEKVRRALCAYGPDAKRCDCKYIRAESKQANRRMSETDSGCCELRQVIDYLNRLIEMRGTDEF